MSEDTPHPSAGRDVRCPTCGAVQEWSDACRRCRCELTLLRRATAQALANRRRCLRDLQAGRIPEALRHARRLYALCPDRPAARLLAVCHLLHGHWAAAAAAARLGDDEMIRLYSDARLEKLSDVLNGKTP
jgi:hypothetical protein